MCVYAVVEEWFGEDEAYNKGGGVLLDCFAFHCESICLIKDARKELG